MESLIKFKRFVDEINKENSRLYKQSILEKYKHDEEVNFYLHWIFSPYVITGISDKKLNKAVALPNLNSAYINMGFITTYLEDHNTGTDTDIGIIRAFRDWILNHDLSLVNLYDKIITKNLQLGVNTTTINKIIPGCIEEFNVQLANKYFDKPEIVKGKDFVITTKIDGSRIIALKEDGKVSFYTRQGQPYEGLIDLEEEMKEWMPDNICLDGEITLLDSTGLTSKDQYKQTMKITRKDGEKHGVKMLVFDCMTAKEFREQSCNIPYSIRRINLHTWLYNSKEVYNRHVVQCGGINYDPLTCYHIHDLKYFNVLPELYRGNNTDKIVELLETQTAKGEEGVMINILDAPYDFKRTNNLLKVKKFNSCDLKVIGFEEGDNKLSNTLGAVLLEYKNSIVKCGSGFTDEQRQEIWNNQDKYLNTIMEISYFEETSNQQGGLSLRFPVFKDFRPDKTEPNI